MTPSARRVESELDETRLTKSLEGQRLGCYRLSARIGAGGMGEVYRARDTKLNRDVAIKVLLPAVANDPGRLARFSREAQLLASLNHPPICTIHDAGRKSSPAYLVMELLEGRTLDQLIPRGGVALEQFFDIAIALADALAAAHRKHTASPLPRWRESLATLGSRTRRAPCITK